MSFKNRIGIIVQARMTSTRLPGKVIMPVLGKPLLEYLIERLQQVRRATDIIIATTINDTDQPIVDLVKSLGVKIFRGSEEDVLSRYFGAAKENGLDVVVRITSDCPLIDPNIVDDVIDVYVKNADSCDYVSNCLARTFPRGMDTEVFPFSLLERAYWEATEQSYREHVTPYIYENNQEFRLLNVAYQHDESRHRWTVDTPEDFRLIKNILETIYPTNHMFKMKDVLDLMNTHQDWFEINSQIEQKKLR